MNYPPQVLRWADLTRSEIDRVGYPFPVEYPLSVCLVESGGSVGQVNPNSGASGLMQIMPGTLDGYNKNNSPKIPLWKLRSKDPQYAPEQMRVGLWVMGVYLKKGFTFISKTNSNPPLSDLIKISDLMYVAGPGLVNQKFGHLPSHLMADLIEHDPDWQPFAHPRKVWFWTMEQNNAQWNSAAIDSWISGEIQNPVLPPPDIATGNGLIAGLLILAVASWWFSKNKKNESN